MRGSIINHNTAIVVGGIAEAYLAITRADTTVMVVLSLLTLPVRMPRSRAYLDGAIWPSAFRGPNTAYLPSTMSSRWWSIVQSRWRRLPPGKGDENAPSLNQAYEPNMVQRIQSSDLSSNRPGAGSGLPRLCPHEERRDFVL